MDFSVFSASMMEHTLRSALTLLVARFSEKTGLSAPTIGKRAINDNTFFARLAKGETGFNIRTYDRIVGWLSANWPEGAEWPADIARPEQAQVAA